MCWGWEWCHIFVFCFGLLFFFLVRQVSPSPPPTPHPAIPKTVVTLTIFQDNGERRAELQLTTTLPPNLFSPMHQMGGLLTSTNTAAKADSEKRCLYLLVCLLGGKSEKATPTLRIPVHLFSWSLDWKFHCFLCTRRREGLNKFPIIIFFFCLRAAANKQINFGSEGRRRLSREEGKNKVVVARQR